MRNNNIGNKVSKNFDNIIKSKDINLNRINSKDVYKRE